MTTAAIPRHLRVIGAAALACGLACPFLLPHPARATDADVCHLQIVPGHWSDRISRTYIPPGEPRPHEHKQYVMIGLFKIRTFCSTHNFVHGASHSAVAFYTIGRTHDFHFLNGRTITKTTAQHQLIVTSTYQWTLPCAHGDGTVRYHIHAAGALEGNEPAQYATDNGDTLTGRTHTYHYPCGKVFRT